MTEKTTVHIDGIDVPLKIVNERRNSIRIYLGKKEAIMRLPLGLSLAEAAMHRKRLIEWMHQLAKKKEGIFNKYQNLDYQNEDTLVVGQKQYLIKITEAKRKTSGGRLKGGIITLTMSDDLNANERSKAIGSLLSRLVAADQLPYIQERVQALNQQFFQKRIKSIKLKYTHSRWGSCSHSGNINLSTRLLFAPQAVIDYVIIHELAHLIEQNHSHRFWALVEKAMPTYKEKEAWLSEFGGQCDF